MARWITVRQSFDYRWHDRSAITHFSADHLGEHFVKDELADFAVEKGYATEGKLDEAKRSTKGTGAKVRSSRSRKGKTDAKAADSRPIAPVGDADAADADRAADRPAVDPDAE
jgi:hypothetical protein